MKDQLVDWAEAFDALEDGVFIVDTEYNIVPANRSFAQLVGYPSEELVEGSRFIFTLPTIED